MNRELHVVYCPQVGYNLFPHDTGKLFSSEIEAAQFVQELRRAGRYAWTECVSREIFDA